jgi:hypothetical protein
VKATFTSSLPSPEQEDAADLTDQDVEGAAHSRDGKHLAELLVRALTTAAPGGSGCRYAVSKHEVRRRHPHLYLRTTLVCSGAPNKLLIHRVDWLKETC